MCDVVLSRARFLAPAAGQAAFQVKRQYLIQAVLDSASWLIWGFTLRVVFDLGDRVCGISARRMCCANESPRRQLLSIFPVPQLTAAWPQRLSGCEPRTRGKSGANEPANQHGLWGLCLWGLSGAWSLLQEQAIYAASAGHCHAGDGELYVYPPSLRDEYT